MKIKFADSYDAGFDTGIEVAIKCIDLGIEKGSDLESVKNAMIRGREDFSFKNGEIKA